MNSKDFTHASNRPDCLIRFNKGIPQSDWLAKYTAAFFSMSRSSVTRCNSFLSRRISALSSD
ncbi:hypothetical protein EA007_26250 [Vibrio anguillarum]|nr:hypothetical protein [Vibrio anguillarum]